MSVSMLALATKMIVILATSDQHGHVAEEARLGHYFAEERAQAPGRVLAVDGGDIFQGTLVSNLHEGAAMIHAFNALGYAATAVGNHEFDFGPAGPHTTPQSPGEDPRGALEARMHEAHFPLLSANIVEARSGKPFTRPWTIVTVDGVKVSIVGGTAEDTPRTTNSRNLVGLKVLPLAPAVGDAARAARKAGATVVIAVVHAGGNCSHNVDHTDREPGNIEGCEVDAESFRLAHALAARTDGGRVDAIFGGHTHQGVNVVVDGIPILQAYDNVRAFSKLELEVDEHGRPTGHFVAHAPERVRADAPADGAVAAAVAQDLAEVEKLKSRKVGVTLPAVFRRAYRAESPLGNLVADEIREATHADVGLTNGGGLRADLPAGELTYGALFEALPFDNRLATMKLSAAALKALLARNFAHDKGILSVSGIHARARCDAGKLSIELAHLDGKPIADDATLVIGTTDFLANGGDDFGPTIAGAPPSFLESEPLRDVVAAALGRGALHGAKELKSETWFDPARRRIDLPMPKPVVCRK
ncbi:MAG TPA: 5'-nucleotidase C-terminal domain-containing protein [Polyangia bacterium]|nr:5'-nucleotidase C-terminal domain-containing protein [Polyangia bacterium]